MAHHGQGFPRLARRALDAGRLRLRRRLSRDLRVSDGEISLVLRCATADEYNRATHLFTREAGTVSWLRETVQPGAVVWDVGANVGAFSLIAATLAGREGHVCAFEPHAANVEGLLHNLAANGLDGRVTVVSSALADAEGWMPFHYRELQAASGLSQLARTRDPHGRDARPAGTELKHTVTADSLLRDGTIPAPDLVKIDVDGAEAAVVRGMRTTLTAPTGPRSVQVEVNPDSLDQLLFLLSDCGYELTSRHWSLGAQQELDKGAAPETLGFNGIFTPSA